jgi:hypothetical protein
MTTPTHAEERIHELKTWPDFFGRVVSGEKTFEIRHDDRGFRVGDVLWLREWSKAKGYSGREVHRRVTYLLGGAWPGLTLGYVAMAIAPIVETDHPDDLTALLKELELQAVYLTHEGHESLPQLLRRAADALARRR